MRSPCTPRSVVVGTGRPSGSPLGRTSPEPDLWTPPAAVDGASRLTGKRRLPAPDVRSGGGADPRARHLPGHPPPSHPGGAQPAGQPRAGAVLPLRLADQEDA